MACPGAAPPSSTNSASFEQGETGMHEEDDDPFDTYAVVVNHEEQYSIWPTEKPMPNGWRAAGRQGSKQECLDHIAEVWTDMRPLSLRRLMEEWARNPPPAVPLI